MGRLIPVRSITENILNLSIVTDFERNRSLLINLAQAIRFNENKNMTCWKTFVKPHWFENAFCVCDSMQNITGLGARYVRDFYWHGA